MAVGLDSFGVTFLAKELRDLLLGCVVRSISLRDDRLLIIAFEDRGAPDLVFLAEPTLPLLCASQRIGRGERLPHPTRLEEPLRGSAVTDVCQIELDRIVMLTVKAGRERVLRLYFEIIPPFPNMFLTDVGDSIIEPLFKTGTRTRRRILQRGDSYEVPHQLKKIHPADVVPEVLESLDWRRWPDILSKKIIGLSPFLSREMVARAGKQASLYQAFSQVLTDYREARVAPCVFTTGQTLGGAPPFRGLAWFRPATEDVYAIEPKKTLNDAVESVMAELLATGKLETLRAAAIRAVAKKSRKWKKVMARATEARDERADADRLRRFGKIVVSNLGKIKKGSPEVRLPDVYSTDQREVTIPLEPRLTPQANAEVYFKRARKTLRRAERSAQELETAESRLQSLRDLRKEVESSQTSEKRMAEIVDTLSARAAQKAEERHPGDEKAERLGIRPRRYVVAGGWTVLVGRNARENDILTHRYASPSDLWFHARQAQGSHVVLRKDRKRTQVPKEAIIQAAQIAAHHSKARTSKHVPVSYTEKRYVKKVKKGPPGVAAMLREKVIFVNPGLPG